MKKRPVVFAAVFGVLSVFGLIFCAALLRFTDYPELKQFRTREVSRAVTDRNGRVLRILPLEDGLRREYMPLDEIPPEILAVFIRSEDKRFFLHGGIDGFAVLRSALQNLRAGRVVSGASTITMQLASMIKPRPLTLAGKIAEGWDAVRLEARLSKGEILELWINSLPFGRQAEGIASGSRAYFGVPPAELSPAEARVLAKIPRRPEKYSTEAGASDASAGCVFEAPHFVTRVQERILQDLQIPEGTGDIVTTLDLELQHRLLYDFRFYLGKYRESRISGCAALVLDNHTGEVLAYIGSPDYFSDAPGMKIDAVMIENQPGSCLKPFLYAAALDEGLLPCSLLPDIPMDFGGSRVYVPMNFNNRFHGPVRLRVALGSSLNVPAVYLQSRLGSDSFSRVLEGAGFSGVRRKMERAGLGAALGNIEVSLFELVRAFTIFPGGGTPVEPVWTRHKPVHRPGGGQASHGPDNSAVSPYTAYTICSILSDPGARITGFGSHSAFDLPFSAMFKTGTSNQYQNIWALAATMDYTVGVWMGNLTGETVIGRTGSSLPAVIAGNALEYLHREADPQSSPKPSPEAFPVPDGTRPLTVCALSGMEATDACPSTTVEHLPADAVIEPCSFHVRGGETGAVRVVYPEPYRSWAARFGRTAGTGRTGGAAEDTAENGARRSAEAADAGPAIIYPADGAVYYYDPASSSEQQAVRIEVAGGEGPVQITVNGEQAAELTSQPYVWYFPLRRGHWTVEVSDAGGADAVRFEVR
jgi:penicillin-binding protein 1C